ncbi:MAG: hypothetical protein K6C68_11525 [Ruminococcus sp.]|nr:hypothetical protein [Ruminococcus sp.]
MQSKSYKKVLTFALVLSMMMPIGSAAADTAAEVNAEAETSAADTEAAAEVTEEPEAEAQEAEAADPEAAGEGETANDSAAADDAAAETDDAAAEDAESEEDEDEEEPAVMISDEEALKTCEAVAENDKLKLWMDEENLRFCLQTKSSGKCWWSSPINAEADPTIVDGKDGTMKKGQIQQAQSSMAINIGDLRQEKRTELPAPAYSSRARVKFRKESNGFAATYNYGTQGVRFTAHFELTDKSLHVYVDTKDIVEKDNESENGKVLTKLLFCPYMGAASTVDASGAPVEGYMIVPDGGGAVINYNNGKTNYASYQQRVYGTDYTAVPLNAPRVTEQAYIPVLATVQGSDGLVMVASEGEANVWTNAQISGQNKQAYNNCYFMFETRSTDEFFMSGTDSNKITVFEKYGIKTDRFGVEYFPVENTAGVNYADCAKVYRDYLVDEKGLEQKTAANDSDLYIDTFGGVLKEESIIGIPITLKKRLTTFSQAKTIIEELNNAGADKIVMNYNDWTDKSIKEQVSTKAKASGKLGKNSDLLGLNNDNTVVYSSMNNFTMKKGSWGYSQLSNTAIRVSSAYSRQSEYSPAFGVAITGVSPALIAPNTYVKIFDQTLKSFKDAGFENVGYGDWSSKLVSDFSKKNGSSRNDTMKKIVDGYKAAVDDGEKIIAAGANSYVLPYVSAVTDIPVYSSAFNITDGDIPFYQMVIHGYVPYSTKAINASSNTDLTFMRALAAGSNLNYDMIYEDADELLDTRDDDYFYSHYSGWVTYAANQYKVASKVLAAVSDYTISDYVVEGDVIKTTYSKDGQADVVIEVDTANLKVKVGGETIDLVAEGAVEEGGAKS